ncbi:hypothetical protein JTB14_035823 [Gonioctena quinquepunctata]|nr:hypothetical protein JTB14_035823 [Gonioctena quinquepunctata]
MGQASSIGEEKDGSIRSCVDYRKSNDVTRKSFYPIPNIDDILTHLGGAKYLSMLDMFSGYWQVKIEENSMEYTAFTAQVLGFATRQHRFRLCATRSPKE